MNEKTKERPTLVRLEMSVSESAAQKLGKLQRAHGWTRGEVVEALLETAELPTISTEAFHELLVLWSAVESLGLGLAARDDATAIALISALYRIEVQLAAIITVNNRTATP